MFLAASDERLFLQTLAAYEQEFGVERIVAIFPYSWAKKIDPAKFHPIKCETWDLNGVGIRVNNCTANFTLLVI